MGWQDAPLVTDNSPQWANAPVVGDSGDKPQQDSKSLVEKLGDAVFSMNPVILAATAVRDPKPLARDVGNVIAGGVRGAGSIGATILTPLDILARKLGISNDYIGRDDRRQSMDQALTSMGADPNSGWYQAGKVGAEIAGTAGIPGAAGKAVVGIGRAAASPLVEGLGSAIESGGLSIGPLANSQPAGIAANALNAARNGATRIAGGAAAGALTAGAVDPDDAETGAAIGAAVPVVVKGAGIVGSALGKTYAAVSSDAAQKQALKKIAGALGDDNAIQQAIADVQTYYPKGAESIPVSAAGITTSPALAQLEQGSRIRSAPAWNDFDMKQGRAVADNVLDATKDADAIGQLRGARKDTWDAGWDWAQQNLKPRVWTNRITQFYDDVGRAQEAAESSNPDVLNVLKQIQGEMDRLGPNFGPGNLQQMRANLAEGYNPASSNPFKTVSRDSPAVQTIKSEMDDILNASTGDRWQKVLDGYAKNSDAIRSSDAARTVRNAFWDEQTGRVLGKSRDALGDIPSITEVGLGSAMNKARLPDKSLALAPDANQQLEATLEALRRQNIVQNLKRTATAGGGSDTISNAAADAVVHATHAPNLLLQLMGAVRQVGLGKTDAQLARLLSSPDDMAQGLGALSRVMNKPPIGQPVYRALPLLATQGD